MDPDPASLFYSIDFEFLIGIIAIVLLLICSAFISGSEVALFSLSQKDIDEIMEKDFNKGNLISELLEKPKKLLATILVANNFVNIAVVILFSSFSGKMFNSIASSALRFTLEVVLVTFFLLLFGEVLPKIYANRNNIVFAQKVAVSISLLNKILSPISVPMRNSIHFIEKKLNVQKGNFSVNQLSQALELTSQSDTTDGEQKILEGIVTFGNTEVRQVMSPRIDVFSLNIEETFKEIMPKIIEKGYSRIPVYKENIDQIEGILFIKDLIPHIDNDNFNWVELLREPFFVPENKKLDDLLKDFQSMKSHLAVVVDEYGGTSGIISLEDVLEEIVGDISDEFDDEDLIYSQIDDNNFLFEGKISLKDFYRIIDVNEEEFERQKGEAETLAGFLLEISGNFPKKSQKITFHNLIFTIENVDKRRIKQIKVTL
ncbi:MAG: gliding motility-associated protein GldE [Flavobacterium sp.]|nr:MULTISPECIES: gliding motility-associated protein GldE [unclassified Flavobacterium]MDP5028516.1 gliding motility-associated protein GldE [Flavobacterium sp.]MDP5097199.1 gliding motility-associated protein GldE [Flavobacterium sp.]MQP52713.1 gliding motility-associated protein GldE [Flavobacterium sp. LMO9]MQP62107.1 gliding motility-associated protein GldE [Flavobacterium sp. LMO6]